MRSRSWPTFSSTRPWKRSPRTFRSTKSTYDPTPSRSISLRGAFRKGPSLRQQSARTLEVVQGQHSERFRRDRELGYGFELGARGGRVSEKDSRPTKRMLGDLATA